MNYIIYANITDSYLSLLDYIIHIVYSNFAVIVLLKLKITKSRCITAAGFFHLKFILL